MTEARNHDRLADRIRAERLAAAAAMDSLGGNRSACALGRNGQSFPAYKYHEGRAAALGDLGRQLRRSGDLEATLGTLEQRWEGEVGRRAGTGRDWEAYAAGGRDAVRTVADWLRTP